MSGRSLNTIIESVFPLASEVYEVWRATDRGGFWDHRYDLKAQADDVHAPITDRVTSVYKLLIADALDFASYAENHVRSGDPHASFKNEQSGGHP